MGVDVPSLQMPQLKMYNNRPVSIIPQKSRFEMGAVRDIEYIQTAKLFFECCRGRSRSISAHTSL